MRIRKNPHSSGARIFTLKNGAEVEVTIEGDQLSVRSVSGPLVVRPVVSNVITVLVDKR